MIVNNNEKIKLYIPNNRLDYLHDDTKKKIQYLENQASITYPVNILPDLSEDGLILSGLNINTTNSFFPLSAGLDLGCGYRVLTSTLRKDDLVNVENHLFEFANRFTGKEKTINEISLFNLFWNKEYEKLNNYFEKHYGINAPFIKKRNDKASHLLSEKAFYDAWGNIAIGNHFIELREVVSVENKTVASELGIYKDSIIFHIHSGAGKAIEDEFIQYWLKFIKEYKQKESIQDERNGYEIIASLESQISKDYLDDVVDSMNFSILNRSLISCKLQEFFDSKLIDLFDAHHDGFVINDNKITSQKGVQAFKKVAGHDIAIIPGSLNSNSYIVKRKADIPFINHGTGEGKQGTHPNYSNVITNLKNPIYRKYHDIETTIKYGVEQGLFEVIAELKPVICVKKEREVK